MDRGGPEQAWGPCIFGGHMGEEESEIRWEGRRGEFIAERLKGSEHWEVLAEKAEARLQVGEGETRALHVDRCAQNFGRGEERSVCVVKV